MKKNNKSKDLEIPGMDLENKYSSKKNIIPKSSEKIKKNLEKTKKEIEKLKSFIVKKYKYTMAIGLLPPQAIKHFIEEEEVPKQTEKFIHLYIVVPEEKLKEIPKMKQEVIKQIDFLKQKIWVQIKTPIDIWEICSDSKFQLFASIAMSFPIYDRHF